MTALGLGRLHQALILCLTVILNRMFEEQGNTKTPALWPNDVLHFSLAFLIALPSLLTSQQGKAVEIQHSFHGEKTQRDAAV